MVAILSPNTPSVQSLRFSVDDTDALSSLGQRFATSTSLCSQSVSGALALSPLVAACTLDVLEGGLNRQVVQQHRSFPKKPLHQTARSVCAPCKTVSRATCSNSSWLILVACQQRSVPGTLRHAGCQTQHHLRYLLAQLIKRKGLSAHELVQGLREAPLTYHRQTTWQCRAPLSRRCLGWGRTLLSTLQRDLCCSWLRASQSGWRGTTRSRDAVGTLRCSRSWCPWV